MTIGVAQMPIDVLFPGTEKDSSNLPAVNG
jgi:hypothetical protein